MVRRLSRPSRGRTAKKKPRSSGQKGRPLARGNAAREPSVNFSNCSDFQFMDFSDLSYLLESRFSKCRPNKPFLQDFQNVDQKPIIFARFSNVDQQPMFCKMFEMPTNSQQFVRFSKLRPKASFCYGNFQNVNQNHFFEIFQMPTKSPNVASC